MNSNEEQSLETRVLAKAELINKVAHQLFLSGKDAAPMYNVYGNVTSTNYPFSAEQIRIAAQLVKDFEREDKYAAAADSLFDGVKVGE